MLSYLNKLEQNLSEPEYLAGEGLLDSIVSSRVEKKRGSNFRVFLEEGDQNIEVAIKFIDSKNYSGSCNCKNKKDACEHIYASLFLIRRKLSEPVKQSSKPKSRSRKTEFQRILEAVKQEDLINFIKSYSRKNQHFKLELEAHFSSKVDFENNESKYKSVLDRVVKPKSNVHPKLVSSSIYTFKKILNDYWAQANDMFSLDRFDEVFYATRYSLEKLFYCKFVYEIQQDFIEEYISNFLDLLRSLLSKDLAPEFRDKVQADIIQFCQYSFCIPLHANNVHAMVFESIPLTALQMNEILEDIDKKINDSNDHRANTIMGQVLVSPLDNDAKYNWIKEKYTLSRVIKSISILSQANIDHYETLLKRYNDEFPEIQEVSYLLIRDSIRNEKYAQALETLIHMCEKGQDISRSIAFFQLVPVDLYLEYRDVLIEKIKNYPAYQKIKLFHNFRDDESIFKTITEENDAQLMMAHDMELLEDFESEIKSFYISWTQGYLKEHIGSKSKERIQEILTHLKSIGAKDIANEVKGSIDSNFNHRKNILLIK